jgi:two-component system, NarL family, response regulator DevR
MLVDDHEVVRGGVRALLEAADDIVVCGEAASAREAVAVADRALPDVVVMDVKLQDGSGVEATREIRAARPQTRVLMLTSYADDEVLLASIMAGAAGTSSSRPGAATWSGPSRPSGAAGACWTRR